ncbi:hypothetical protein [Brevundimonas guildfordensis]|jgi:hypothetical protein|uniref:DUF2007 domain-containing protein n=1 Tax=Brevundimonas guildfordensis TaxID=2762241 RepID=A0ABR8R3D8_9CAUL|nr:hypothetical protein [Brevundimonas guildfordensis]MBD7942305.1 hypothetical protein [Brevundimonas guildfordensis]
MVEIVIARFSTQAEAELTASFLRRHGVRARVPSFAFAESVGSPAGAGIGELPVIVKADQAKKAWKLLKRVRAGEFVGEVDSDNPRRRLGAQLSEVLLPVPGYTAPSRWVARAPLLAIAVLFILSLFGATVFRLLRVSLG